MRSSAEVVPQEITVEDSKFQLENATKLGNQFPTRQTCMVEARRELSVAARRMNMQTLLRASFKGRISTGESVGDVVRAMLGSAVVGHLGYLNDERLLNEGNSALDFGERPIVVWKKRQSRGSNGFVVPQSSRSRLVVEYGECRPRYCFEDSYRSSVLGEQGIGQDEYEETVRCAGDIVGPFRGAVVRAELCFLLVLCIGLATSIAVGLALGALFTYIITGVMCGTFVAVLAGTFVFMKKRNARLLLYAHVALALFLRCENNRLYLKHRVLVRPGYMAKWMEFNMLPSRSANTDAA